MVTLLTLIVITVSAVWIVMIITRKRRELIEKESLQRERFLQETRSILKTEAPSFAPADQAMPTPLPAVQNFIAKVTDYFINQGYKLGDPLHLDGIDMIGLKEKELLMVRCENTLKEVTQRDLKDFIADCTVYIDNNPMLNSRTPLRVYATTLPLTINALEFARINKSSIHILEKF